MSSRRSQDQKRLRRGAYLLPSLFTIGNLFLGFYAMVAGLQGSFGRAAVVIFVAALLDALDGRIARLTGTESEFGKQFDALADVVTFGAAPALLAYLWGLEQLGRLGWLVPMTYLVCTATRLARFNVQGSHADSRYFVGLPAPAAAGGVAAFLLFTRDLGPDRWLAALLLLILLGLAVLMVSTFRYRSFRELDLRRRWSYRIALPVAVLLVLVLADPPTFFLCLAVVYILSGPVLWLVGRYRGRERQPGGRLDERESIR